MDWWSFWFTWEQTPLNLLPDGHIFVDHGEHAELLDVGRIQPWVAVLLKMLHFVHEERWDNWRFLWAGCPWRPCVVFDNQPLRKLFPSCFLLKRQVERVLGFHNRFCLFFLLNRLLFWALDIHSWPLVVLFNDLIHFGLRNDHMLIAYFLLPFFCRLFSIFAFLLAPLHFKRLFGFFGGGDRCFRTNLRSLGSWSGDGNIILPP